jgi:hypothetical protein
LLDCCNEPGYLAKQVSLLVCCIFIKKRVCSF